jgi:hypothetical protein
MPAVSSYALQWSNLDFSAISTSTLDLFITDGHGSNIRPSGLAGISEPLPQAMRMEPRCLTS